MSVWVCVSSSEGLREKLLYMKANLSFIVCVFTPQNYLNTPISFLIHFKDIYINKRLPYVFEQTVFGPSMC